MMIARRFGSVATWHVSDTSAPMDRHERSVGLGRLMAYQGAIFDVDGVLVDSPHELAWREALMELMEGNWRDIRDRTSWTAERFTTQVYQHIIAGKPRQAGARA